ncbi:MAG: hypothetical protein JSR66_12435 [Proteobacteria bacterium]|nr:hypothetical protein [Pseudomonadota bacterium]
MKASKPISVTVLCLGLFGCGGGDSSPAMMSMPPATPAPPASVTIGVHDVLVLSQSQSETSDPLNVNGGSGGSISGSDETSDPVAVE